MNNVSKALCSLARQRWQQLLQQHAQTAKQRECSSSNSNTEGWAARGSTSAGTATSTRAYSKPRTSSDDLRRINSNNNRHINSPDSKHATSATTATTTGTSTAHTRTFAKATQRLVANDKASATRDPIIILDDFSFVKAPAKEDGLLGILSRQERLFEGRGRVS